MVFFFFHKEEAHLKWPFAASSPFQWNLLKGNPEVTQTTIHCPIQYIVCYMYIYIF